ncbi:MAG: hypothetical protein KC933_34210 [Myxococcales bacterium]|nr:hypothetical protein [Myxococcales bacterium]
MRHLALTLALLLSPTAALAQYTPSAGQNAPAEAYAPKPTADGKVRFERLKQAPAKDGHGNAAGNQYDLAVDGAFKGQTVLILDQVGNTLVNTRAALAEKGLSTVVYPPGLTPPVRELQSALQKSCELWLISTSQPQLTDDHIRVIKAFFDAGHGVYIWCDNDPLYADANRVASALVPGLGMRGDRYGDLVVGLAERGSAGVAMGHLITTGLEHLYEGVTIATLLLDGQSEPADSLYGGKLEQPGRAWDTAIPAGFTPLLYGSAGNLVSAAYEKDGRRLVIDGGFTRLAVSWDDAGTARFVKNAAAWLVNAERFREKVAVGAPR